MRGIAAVRPRCHVAAKPGRAARAAVARRATVRQASADRENVVHVAVAVLGERADTLRSGELPLEQLPSAADRPEWIARDDKRRRIRREPVAATGADLCRKRLGDPFVGEVGRERLVNKLRLDPRLAENTEQQHGDAGTAKRVRAGVNRERGGVHQCALVGVGVVGSEHAPAISGASYPSAQKSAGRGQKVFRPPPQMGSPIVRSSAPPGVPCMPSCRPALIEFIAARGRHHPDLAGGGCCRTQGRGPVVASGV